MRTMSSTGDRYVICVGQLIRDLERPTYRTIHVVRTLYYEGRDFNATQLWSKVHAFELIDPPI